MSTFELNRLLYDLREPANREACRKDPEAYYRRYELQPHELELLLDRDWAGLVAAGANVYLLTKLGATLDVSLLEMGAQMRGQTMPEFQAFLREQGERNRAHAILLD